MHNLKGSGNDAVPLRPTGAHIFIPCHQQHKYSSHEYCSQETNKCHIDIAELFLFFFGVLMCMKLKSELLPPRKRNLSTLQRKGTYVKLVKSGYFYSIKKKSVCIFCGLNTGYCPLKQVAHVFPNILVTKFRSRCDG
jgi:hypothetical protein